MPALIAVLALFAVSLLLARCGADDAAQLARSRPPAPADRPAADPAPQSGTVIAGDADVLGAENLEKLRASNNVAANGRSVRVQSVPADEGFWVGPDDRDRLWVQLTGTHGESVFKVERGDTISFKGAVRRVTTDYLKISGVTGVEGIHQLKEQGYYLSVPASSVKLF
ncbi:hypothetical protein [Actinoplanes sp. NPDC051859]|uniref:hypothetical protein n=1 Tax=Actinoplanes sp. NPDC051859 TaxID=3363909 RepID=UPI003796C896